MKKVERKLEIKIIESIMRAVKFLLKTKQFQMNVGGKFLLRINKIVDDPFYNTIVVGFYCLEDNKQLLNKQLLQFAVNYIDIDIEYKIKHLYFNPPYKGLFGKRNFIEEVKKKL